MEKKSLKELMELCNSDVTVSFCGAPITVSSNKYLYSKIFAKYDAFAKTAYSKLFTKVSSLNKWNDLEELYDAFIDCANPIIDEISRDAISIDCYYLDKNTIINICESQGYFAELNNIVLSISNQYSEITEKYNIDVANREQLKEGRAKFQTFTVSNRFRDAIKNELKAEFANAATGFIFDIFNAKANKKSKNEAIDQLNAVFNSNTTSFIAMAGIAYNRFYNIPIALINDNNIDVENFQISDFDINSAKTMYNNIKNLDLPINKQYDLARKIITNVPYEKSYYTDFYNSFIDYRSEIFNVAAFFGVDLSLNVFFIASEYIRSHLDQSLDKDINEIKNALNYFEKITQDYSLTTNYTQDLFNIINEYFLKYLEESITSKLSDSTATFYTTKTCRESLENRLFEYNNAVNVLLEKNINIHISSKEQQTQELYNIIAKRESDLLYQQVETILNNSSDSLIKALEHIVQIVNQYNLSSESAAPAKELVARHFIDINIGSSKEDAENCLERFREYVVQINLDIEYSNKCLKLIQDKIEDRDLNDRTVSGIVVESKNKADEIRDFIMKFPNVFNEEYSYNSRDEIMSSISTLKKLSLPYEFESFYSEKLNKKLKEYDKACVDNLINKPPIMISHSDYEDYIEKLQAISEDERAIDQAYLQEINLRRFEKSCKSASEYEKKANKKIWWFDFSLFIQFYIILAFIASIVIAIFSYAYHDDMTLFTNPLTYFIAIPILTILSFSIVRDDANNNKEAWKKVTSNGKYSLKSISYEINPNRKKTGMPRFENGETSFSQIGQVNKLPDNRKTALLTKDTKINSPTITEIKKGEYVGIISSEQVFYYVKYYSKDGIYYGYILKKYLSIQNLNKN